MRRWIQFSKKVIIAMTLVWFVGAVFGAYMVYRTGGELSSLLSFIGAPMTVGILGYLLKAAFENKEKIKKNGADTQPEPQQKFPE
ncbi:MAG: hypothetical protein ACOX60_06390 [Massiliimalia sp.]|jgi:hypothetical protein